MTRRRAILWLITIALATVVVFVAAPFNLPWTVSSAVRRIELELKQEDRDWILHNSKDAVGVSLHMSLGRHVRNDFGLWGRNWILRAACGHSHPDEWSAVILEALWHSIRQTSSPAFLHTLDEHFQRVGSARIDYSGFHLLHTGEMISRIQTQLNQQAVVTGGLLRLTTSGDPNLDCYTRADFTGEPVPLEQLLNWIGWRNGFSIRHNPPNIELIFHGRCAWPEPPTHFASPTK